MSRSRVNDRAVKENWIADIEWSVANNFGEWRGRLRWVGFRVDAVSFGELG